MRGARLEVVALIAGLEDEKIEDGREDDPKDGKQNKKDLRSIDVVTGSLCLFPSSLLHYTIPFESDEDRIVLAFDMIPNK